VFSLPRRWTLSFRINCELLARGNIPRAPPDPPPEILPIAETPPHRRCSGPLRLRPPLQLLLKPAARATNVRAAIGFPWPPVLGLGRCGFWRKNEKTMRMTRYTNWNTHSTQRGSALLFAALSLTLACGGVDKPNVGIAADATGGATTGGAQNTMGGSGGAVSSGGMAMGGTGGQAPAPCTNDAKQCAVNEVQVCQNGAWVKLADCGGATPVCSGAGVCASYRLVNSGIDVFAVRPPENPQYVLKEQSLSMTARSCGAAYCVTGGIR